MDAAMLRHRLHQRGLGTRGEGFDDGLYPDRIGDRRAFGFTAEPEAAGVLPPFTNYEHREEG